MSRRVTDGRNRARGTRRPAAEAGAVLLEAVLAMPLFMVLIGGAMWMGDLALARQRLVIADRYAAWNMANRHKDYNHDEIQDRFFESAHGDYESVIYALPIFSNPMMWSWDARGQVGLFVSMPIWIKGWLSAGDKRWDAEATQAFRTLRGREEGGHRVVMRARWGDDDYAYPYVVRNFDGRNLADPVTVIMYLWHLLPGEPYALESGMAVPIQYNGKVYTRYYHGNPWAK